jgi:hypothetical protein
MALSGHDTDATPISVVMFLAIYGKKANGLSLIDGAWEGGSPRHNLSRLGDDAQV